MAVRRSRPKISGSTIASRQIFLWGAAILALTACAEIPRHTVKSGDAGTSLTILRPTTYRADGWRDVPIRGKTDYSVVARDGRSAIMAIGRHTASGLARRANIDPKTCRNIRWSWRVDQMQAEINLRQKSKEDVAASLFLTFGDPGFMMMPNPVPTLRYVWTTDHMKIGVAHPVPWTQVCLTRRA